MADTLERVLQLVAEGRLTAEEAAPILDALNAADDAIRDGMAAAEMGAAASGDAAGRTGPLLVLDDDGDGVRIALE
jgi:hypothetical protein